MMYQKKLVVAIKVDGRVLREDNDVVILPFGSEYSILLKNLDSVRVKFKIDIDGKDATGWIILNPNSSLDLERFLNGNLDSGNRFKFIERNEAVENHHGIKAEDGLIRIEYQHEKKPEVIEHVEHVYHKYHHYPNYCHNPWWYPYTIYNGNLGVTDNSNQCINYLSSSAVGSAISEASLGAAVTDTSQSDIGITVPGSISDQKFYLTDDFSTYDSEVMVIRLKGKVGETFVQRPITVEIKPKCITCGKTNKSSNKFCSQCGTSLQLI